MPTSKHGEPARMAAPACVDDFYHMPPALRRKLFSNLERFRLEQVRLAQTHHVDEDCRQDHRQPPAPTSTSSSTDSASEQRPAISFLGPRKVIRRGVAASARRDFFAGTKKRRFPTSHGRRGLLNSGSSRRKSSSSSSRIPRRPDRSPQPVTQAEAEWFHSLPPKIQRRHFSPDEQARFNSSWRASVILDAADKALYRRGQQEQQRRRRSSIASVASAPTLSSGASLSTESMASSDLALNGTHDARESIYDSFRWLDEDDELDLTLGEYDYHNHIGLDSSVSSSTPTRPSNQRRPSFRRTFSLNSFQRNSRNGLNLNASRSRPTTQSFAAPASTTVSRAPSVVRSNHGRSFSRAASNPVIPKHGPQSSVTSIEQPAQYYQDPDARLKLRVYLASPQKFDEAVEFGFPSLDERNNNGSNTNTNTNTNINSSTSNIIVENISVNASNGKEDHMQHCPSTTRRSRSYDQAAATFFEGNSVSYLDDSTPTTDSKTLDLGLSTNPPSPSKLQQAPEAVDPEPQSQLQLSSPTKPDEAPTSPTGAPRHSSSLQPRKLHPHRLSHNLSGGREMTLKMTLTRADLRTADSALSSSSDAYGYDTGNDPLKLADLPAVDEGKPIWDTPEQQGTVRRLWQKLRRRRA